MSKSYYLPADDNGKASWLNNLSGKLPTYQSALWQYKGIYLQADARVGQWSDVVSILVAG